MISLENVEKIYQTQQREIHALRGVSLLVEAGEIFGIIGRLAAGKSTLLRCINLVEKPTHGKVIVDNCDLTALENKSLHIARRSMGMISQHPNLLNSRSVFNNIALPLELVGTPKIEIEQIVHPLLTFIGLAEKANAYPAELTEIQKHRVALARALVLTPKVLLCDEPTALMDSKTTHSFLQLLKEVNEHFNLTIVIFTSDMEVIKSLCHRVAVLHHGKIVEQNTVTELYANPQSQLCKDLIKTTSRLELPLTLRKRLRPHPNENSNPVVRMSFIGANAEEALIAYVIQQFNLMINIMQAHVEKIQEEHIGIMIAEITGDSHNINQALEFLAGKNLYIEVLGHATRAA